MEPISEHSLSNLRVPTREVQSSLAAILKARGNQYGRVLVLLTGTNVDALPVRVAKAENPGRGSFSETERITPQAHIPAGCIQSQAAGSVSALILRLDCGALIPVG